MSILTRTLTVFALLLLVVEAAPAQGRRQPQRREPPKIPTDPFTAGGTVQAVWLGRIHIHTILDQDWMIWFAPNAKIQVTGTAEPGFLARGMFVRCRVTVDQKGFGDAPVEELVLFTPSPENPVGAWPEGSEPGTEHEGGMQDHPAVGRRGRQPPPEKATYTIAGQITSVRKDLFTVNSGRGVVRFKVHEKAKINVDFADYTTAKPGDKIEITKGKMIRGLLGRAQASEVKIELAKPLADPRKKPTKKPTRRRSTPKPDQKDHKEGNERSTKGLP